MHRPAVCQLLIDAGMKPDLSTCHQESPIEAASWKHFASEYVVVPGELIDTLRLFLEYTHECDALIPSMGRLAEHAHKLGLDVLQWLWNNCEPLLDQEDVLTAQTSIVEGCWLGYKQLQEKGIHQDLLAMVMDQNFREHMQSCALQLLDCSIGACQSSTRSYDIGAAYLDWLLSLGIDVEDYIGKALEQMPHGMPATYFHPARKVIFKKDSNQDWVLGFEWAFDSELAGYMLVSEYSGLLVDWMGPTEQDDIILYGTMEDRMSLNLSHSDMTRQNAQRQAQRHARFERRIADKAKKERARLGQKQSKSKMPGGWQW